MLFLEAHKSKIITFIGVKIFYVYWVIVKYNISFTVEIRIWIFILGPLRINIFYQGTLVFLDKCCFFHVHSWNMNQYSRTVNFYISKLNFQFSMHWYILSFLGYVNMIQVHKWEIVVCARVKNKTIIKDYYHYFDIWLHILKIELNMEAPLLTWWESNELESVLFSKLTLRENRELTHWNQSHACLILYMIHV